MDCSDIIILASLDRLISRTGNSIAVISFDNMCDMFNVRYNI